MAGFVLLIQKCWAGLGLWAAAGVTCACVWTTYDPPGLQLRFSPFLKQQRSSILYVSLSDCKLIYTHTRTQEHNSPAGKSKQSSTIPQLLSSAPSTIRLPQTPYSHTHTHTLSKVSIHVLPTVSVLHLTNCCSLLSPLSSQNNCLSLHLQGGFISVAVDSKYTLIFIF